MLLGWLVILVTGCLKMEAVCLTGRAVFKSGLPCGDTRAAPGPPGARLLCPLPPRPWHRGPRGEARPRPCPSAALSLPPAPRCPRSVGSGALLNPCPSGIGGHSATESTVLGGTVRQARRKQLGTMPGPPQGQSDRRCLIFLRLCGLQTPSKPARLQQQDQRPRRCRRPPGLGGLRRCPDPRAPAGRSP